MSEATWPLPRVSDDGTLKRNSQTTAFGTAGVSVAVKKGRLYKLRVCNTSASVKYFVQVFDKATAPVAADVPIWEGQVASNSDMDFDFAGIGGLFYVNGFGYALSTTAASLTLAAANDGFGFALYTQVT